MKYVKSCKLYFVCNFWHLRKKCHSKALTFRVWVSVNLIKKIDLLFLQLLIKKKTCLYFLDEMSLAAAQLVHLSRLKINTRLFLDQQPTLNFNIIKLLKHCVMQLFKDKYVLYFSRSKSLPPTGKSM